MSQRWKTFGQTVVINSKSILCNLARLSIHLSIHPLTNEWCFNIDKGMINRDLFPNLKKAFDTIDHAILRGYSFPALQNKVSKDLKGITSWLSANRLALNGRVLETEFMAIGSRQRL